MSSRLSPNSTFLSKSVMGKLASGKYASSSKVLRKPHRLPALPVSSAVTSTIDPAACTAACICDVPVLEEVATSQSKGASITFVRSTPPSVLCIEAGSMKVTTSDPCNESAYSTGKCNIRIGIRCKVSYVPNTHSQGLYTWSSFEFTSSFISFSCKGTERKDVKFNAISLFFSRVESNEQVNSANAHISPFRK